MCFVESHLFHTCSVKLQLHGFLTHGEVEAKILMSRLHSFACHLKKKKKEDAFVCYSFVVKGEKC